MPVTSDILYYEMSIVDTGSSGSNTFNFAVYDDAGDFVSNLFGGTTNRILVSGSNGTDVFIGRDVAGSTTFKLNDAGHTVQFGNLNLTTLLAGYYIVPFVENFATSARSLNFKLRLGQE